MRKSKLLAFMYNDTLQQQCSSVLLNNLNSFARPFSTSVCKKALHRWHIPRQYLGHGFSQHMQNGKPANTYVYNKRFAHILTKRNPLKQLGKPHTSVGLPTGTHTSANSRKSEYQETSDKEDIELFERIALGKMSKETSIPEQNAGWLIRLANENGYLSWCRNVYIATVVGATIHIQNIVPYHKDVAFLFFFMAGLNLLSGTGSFITNVIYLYKKMHMSKLTALYNIAMSVIHLLLWLGAVAIYLGYVEDDDENEVSKDEKDVRPKKR